MQTLDLNVEDRVGISTPSRCADHAAKSTLLALAVSLQAREHVDCRRLGEVRKRRWFADPRPGTGDLVGEGEGLLPSQRREVTMLKMWHSQAECTTPAVSR